MMKISNLRFVKLEETKRINIKQATMFFSGRPEKKDIYIENGMVTKIRSEVRQGLFSGVYELEADGSFAVPYFCDCGCFWLGNRKEGYALPVRNEKEFKQFGFFSFVTTISTDDINSRLFDQRISIPKLNKHGMSARYLTGGLKDKAYHINENIYQDICEDSACVGAAVIYNDRLGSIEKARLEKLCDQVEAARYDTDSPAIVQVLMGDQAEHFGYVSDVIAEKGGRELIIVPWFANRSRRLLTEGVRYIQNGGSISIVAGSDQEYLNEAYIPMWMALLRIYEENESLDGVLLSSFSGGYLPGHDSNTLPQRGEVVYIIENLKKALSEGLPFEEAVKVLCFNPIDMFELPERMIKEGQRAGFLIIDNQMNIKFIVDGDQVISPDSFKTPILFI